MPITETLNDFTGRNIARSCCLVAHHVIWVDGVEEGGHHVDPTRDCRLAFGAAGFIDEIPGKDCGVVLVDAAIHCTFQQSSQRSFGTKELALSEVPALSGS